MQVNQYLFQSPSSSQVQIGRRDTSVKQEDTSSKDLGTTPNQTVADAKAFVATQTSEVKPSVDSHKIDIYA